MDTLVFRIDTVLRAVSKTNLSFFQDFMRGLVITGCGLTLAYEGQSP